jgi:hypothetical protein
MPRTTLPAVRPSNAAVHLSALQVRLDAKESELASLGNDRVTEPATLIRKRHVLNDEISKLRDEENLLQERLGLENADQAAKEHTAKCNRARLILETRLSEFVKLDEALEEVGRCATAIRRLDTYELLPLISGLDSSFDVGNASWMTLSLVRLASLGLGTDKRLDRAAPFPELVSKVKGHHSIILEELRSRPSQLAAERARQQHGFEQIRKVANY